MSFRLGLAVVLLAICMLLPGCTVAPVQAPQSAEPTTQSVGPVPLTQMPQLVGKTLPEVSRALGKISVAVEVQFPATVATAAIEATRVAGALVKAHVAKLDWPESVKALREVANAGHTVVSQSVPPGAAISAVTTITLDVGPHPNDTGIPWMRGHVVAIKRRGASPCFECHKAVYCARCHVGLYGK